VKRNSVQTDILIVGGGIVGAVTALLLEKDHRRVALVESYPPSKIALQPGSYQSRVSALNPESLQLLDLLGIQGGDLRFSYFDKMHIWEGVRNLGEPALDFNCQDQVFPFLGAIVENAALRFQLWALMEKTSIELFAPAVPVSLVQTDSHVKLTLEGGEIIEAETLIASDGAQSWVKSVLGAEEESSNYGHTAIIANVSHTLSHQRTARQCFLPTGPLAFLPLKEEHHSSVVWSCEEDFYKKRMGQTEADFAAELTQLFGQHLGDVALESSRKSFPLTMQHLRRYLHDRVVFVGDAAHRVHPLAGQGMNLGLADAKCLARIQRGEETITRQLLRRYERERKYYNEKMLLAMRGLKNVFSYEDPASQWIREKGLVLLQKNAWAKSVLIEAASGR
jgi:2-octaprenylphenol hydroxylase